MFPRSESRSPPTTENGSQFLLRVLLQVVGFTKIAKVGRVDVLLDEHVHFLSDTGRNLLLVHFGGF